MTTFYLWFMGSLGVCTGLLVFMIAKEGLDWLLGNRAIRKDIIQTDADSLEKLERRNELTVSTNKLIVEMIAVQERIAEALEERTNTPKPSEGWTQDRVRAARQVEEG